MGVLLLRRRAGPGDPGAGAGDLGNGAVVPGIGPGNRLKGLPRNFVERLSQHV